MKALGLIFVLIVGLLIIYPRASNTVSLGGGATSTEQKLLNDEQDVYLATNGEYLQVQRTDTTLTSDSVPVAGKNTVKSFDTVKIPPNTTIDVFQHYQQWGYKATTEYIDRFEYYLKNYDGATSTWTDIKPPVAKATST